jgi:SHS2 domain-containing protein
MTDRRRLRVREQMTVEIEAPDLEALFVDWLNYLLYLYDAKNFLAKKVEILELAATRLKARLGGEELDLQRHLVKTGVKAATYHLLAIRRQDRGWGAAVIFDL